MNIRDSISMLEKLMKMDCCCRILKLIRLAQGRIHAAFRRLQRVQTLSAPSGVFTFRTLLGHVPFRKRLGLSKCRGHGHLGLEKRFLQWA